MPTQTSPKVFLIGQTELNVSGVSAFLNHIGAPTWMTDAPSDNEEVVELMGRLCYKSFGTKLNPNLTRVREGNKHYTENVLSSKHGSVIEHANVNFIFADVSRVFTHELV